MKKILLSSFLFGSLLMAANVNIESLQNLPIVKQANIKVEKFQQLDGIYHIKGSSLAGVPGQPKAEMEFYLTENFKQLIMGRGILTNDGSPIRFPVDIASIKGKEGISFGTGSKVIYVFTDPECPYCKKLERLLPNLGEKYTFKIFLFPLPMHAEAMPMSKYIMAGKTQKEKFDRLIEVANDSKKYQNFTMTQKENDKLTLLVEEQLELGKANDIGGTPTVVDENSNTVDWTKL